MSNSVLVLVELLYYCTSDCYLVRFVELCLSAVPTLKITPAAAPFAPIINTCQTTPTRRHALTHIAPSNTNPPTRHTRLPSPLVITVLLSPFYYIPLSKPPILPLLLVL